MYSLSYEKTNPASGETTIHEEHFEDYWLAVQESELLAVNNHNVLNVTIKEQPQKPADMAIKGERSIYVPMVNPVTGEATVGEATGSLHTSHGELFIAHSPLEFHSSRVLRLSHVPTGCYVGEVSGLDGDTNDVKAWRIQRELDGIMQQVGIEHFRECAAKYPIINTTEEDATNE